MSKSKKEHYDRMGPFHLGNIAYGDGEWLSDLKDRNSLLKTAFFNSLFSYVGLSVSFKGDISSTKEAKIVQEMVLDGSLEVLRGVVRYYRERGNTSLEVHADELVREETSPYEEIFEEIIFEDEDPEE